MAWITRMLAAATLCANGATLMALRGADGRSAPVVADADPSPSAYGATATSRTTDGLFHLDGRAGRACVDFVVDTGASVTVLTAADAQRLGAVRLPEQGGRASLQTAGGRAAMAWWRVPDLMVAGQRLGTVDVAVVEGGLPHALLGQDLLARLGAIAIADDRLVITPAAAR